MSSLRSAKLNKVYQSLSKSHQKLFTIIYDHIYQQIYKEVKEKKTLKGFSWVFSYTELLEYAKNRGFSEELFESVCKSLEQKNLVSYSKTKNTIKIWDSFIQEGGGRGSSTASYYIWVPTSDHDSANLGGRYSKAKAYEGGYVYEKLDDCSNHVTRTEVIHVSWIGGALIRNNPEKIVNDPRYRKWQSSSQFKINGTDYTAFPNGWSVSRNIRDRPAILYADRVFNKPSSTSGCDNFNTDIESYSNNPANPSVCSVTLSDNSPLKLDNGAFKLQDSIEVVTIAPKTDAATYSTTTTTTTTTIPNITTTTTRVQSLQCPPAATDKRMVSVNATQCVQCPDYGLDGTRARAIPNSTNYDCKFEDRVTNMVTAFNVVPVSKVLV